MNYMGLSNRLVILTTFCLTPFCVSSLACATNGWREGFKGNDTLYLVGKGSAAKDLPELQRDAIAREAAVMDAMSHWPKYCGDADATEFGVENQKKRRLECDGGNCRARLVIEKKDLRNRCRS